MPRPHVSGDFCIRKFFLCGLHLASTRVRRIRLVYPEISVYALQSGNFCIHCVSGYVWTLVSVYFCIRWSHSIRTSLFPREIFQNGGEQKRCVFALQAHTCWNSSKQTRKPRIWRQNYRRLSFLCNAHALLTNSLTCPDTNRIRVDRALENIPKKIRALIG